MLCRDSQLFLEEINKASYIIVEFTNSRINIQINVYFSLFVFNETIFINTKMIILNHLCVICRPMSKIIIDQKQMIMFEIYNLFFL